MNNKSMLPCPFFGSDPFPLEWPDGGDTGEVRCLELGCPIDDVFIPIEQWNRPRVKFPVISEPVAVFSIDASGYRVKVLLDPAKPFPPDGTLLYAEQPAPLKIGSGVTVENIGFGSEQERKPYLVFDGGGFLTEVNLTDVSLVSKRQTHTIADLEAIGVRVEQPAPVAVVMPQFDMQMVMMCLGGVRGAVLTSNQCHALAESLNYVARLNGVKP